MSNSRIPVLTIAMALAIYLPLGLLGCKEEPRSALWYMAHGPELQAKLLDCKEHLDKGDHDVNCHNANEAFMTIMTVEAQKAAGGKVPPSADTH